MCHAIKWPGWLATVGIAVLSFGGCQGLRKQSPTIEEVEWEEIMSAPMSTELRDMFKRLEHKRVPNYGLHTAPRGTAPYATGSHFGGRPSLPENMQWPRNERGPLNFLAQIDLATVRGGTGESWDEDPLPSQGTLFFFCDVVEMPMSWKPEERASWAVLYSPQSCGGLPRRTVPSGVPAELRESFVIPPVAFSGRFERSLTYSPKRFPEEMEALPDELSEELFWALADSRSPWHQLLGIPTVIQSDWMESGCESMFLTRQRLSLGEELDNIKIPQQASVAGAKNWILLAQFDSDDKVGINWVDAGTLYYWIRRDDLRERRFDRVEFDLQTH